MKWGISLSRESIKGQPKQKQRRVEDENDGQKKRENEKKNRFFCAHKSFGKWLVGSNV